MGYQRYINDLSGEELLRFIHYFRWVRVWGGGEGRWGWRWGEVGGGGEGVKGVGGWVGGCV